jgi:hypothetical protein
LVVVVAVVVRIALLVVVVVAAAAAIRYHRIRLSQHLIVIMLELPLLGAPQVTMGQQVTIPGFVIPTLTVPQSVAHRSFLAQKVGVVELLMDQVVAVGLLVLVLEVVKIVGEMEVLAPVLIGLVVVVVALADLIIQAL